MISRIKGTLLTRELSIIEVETSGGVVYEINVPSSVMERLPAEGASLEIRTFQVVREDSASLFGFIEAHERELFRRLLTANGVGASMAMAMLSTYSAGRLALALAEKDIPALTQVSGVGKKKAEKFALELADKVKDLALFSDVTPGGDPEVEGAVSALVALGYSLTAADTAVRAAVSEGTDMTTEELIRKALASV